MAIITNFNRLRSLHDAARARGPNSREWIEFAVTMMDSFPALYDVAEAMNEDQAKQRQAAGWTPAVTSVIAERQRQIYIEGRTTEGDDEQAPGRLAEAAACYAHYAANWGWFPGQTHDEYSAHSEPTTWPLDHNWWKPKSPRRDLVKAAALILAEIERIDRVNGEA